MPLYVAIAAVHALDEGLLTPLCYVKYLFARIEISDTDDMPKRIPDTPEYPCSILTSLRVAVSLVWLKDP
jgi:hypothetical protein